MNNTWLLRPGSHLEGVRTVTTRVRPAKVAFVIPDDDRRIALSGSLLNMERQA
jgi:hypothetical protein